MPTVGEFEEKRLALKTLVRIATALESLVEQGAVPTEQGAVPTLKPTPAEWMRRVSASAWDQGFVAGVIVGNENTEAPPNPYRFTRLVEVSE